MNGLRIGDVAKQAGVNLETVRFYERRGLLPKPPRTASGYRAFSAATVRRVRMIKRTQALGFSLKEISELLTLGVDPDGTCADVRQRAQAKLAEIDQKIEGLQRIKKELAELAATCSGRAPTSACPILESLHGSEPSAKVDGRTIATALRRGAPGSTAMLSTLPVLMALSWVPIVKDAGSTTAAAPARQPVEQPPAAAADTITCPITGSEMPSCCCPLKQEAS